MMRRSILPVGSIAREERSDMKKKRIDKTKPEDEKCNCEHDRRGDLHVFGCPVSNQPLQEWEKEFDEIICPLEKMWADQVKEEEIERWRVMYGFTPEGLRENIKSFIRALLEKTRKEAIEEYKKLKSISVRDCEQEIYRNVQGSKKDAKQALLAKLRGEVEGMKKETNETTTDT